MLTSTKTQVRLAGPEDARAIYGLKAAAFGSTSLPYTIYQDPRSARFIASMLRKGHESTGNYFYVVGDPEPVGYYHAVKRKEDFFLNYIAVADTSRGRGLGDELLSHFEEKGKQLGRRTFALDVFSTDESVVEWYKRRGYWMRSSSYHLRVPLESLSALNGELLTCGLWDEFRARRHESRFGFSKLDYDAKNGRVTVGLIGDRVCKLLSRFRDLDFIAGSIARTFHAEREALVLSDLPSLPKGWSLDRWDRSIRMEKREARS
jgi:ribosomal protein S18 acetylase RimI-like enzyme